MKSMTGFGRGEHVSRGTRISVEIGTVNRRHAELVFNLPRELSSIENTLRDVIAPAVTRGRATVTVAISGGGDAKSLLDPGLFRRLQSELEKLQKTLKIPGKPSLSDLIRLYAVSTRESTGARAPDAAAITKAAREAVRALDAMREKEGAHLAGELSRLLRRFSAEISAIVRMAPKVAKAHRDALRTRLDALDPAFAAEDERLARELALFADRSDITEELSRLQSHIKQFRTTVASPGATGRSLDFLAQEMFRECNTIGSKANAAEVTRRVIAAKTELERLREQVQNVE